MKEQFFFLFNLHGQKNQIHSFIFQKNLQRANLLTVLSDLYLTGQAFTQHSQAVSNWEAILIFWKIIRSWKLFCLLDDKLLAGQLSKKDYFFSEQLKKRKEKRTPLCKVQSAATFCRSHLATLKVNGDWKHFMIPHKRQKNTTNFFVR